MSWKFKHSCSLSLICHSVFFSNNVSLILYKSSYWSIYNATTNFHLLLQYLLPWRNAHYWERIVQKQIYLSVYKRKIYLLRKRNRKTINWTNFLLISSFIFTEFNKNLYISFICYIVEFRKVIMNQSKREPRYQ